MAAKYIKFVIVKLILVIFAAVCAALVAFLLSATLSDATDAAFRTAVTSIVPAVVFFAFIYSFESKIKIPDGVVLSTNYFLAFALRETSVYAIFQIPLTVITAVLGTGILDDGIGSYFILPHLSAARYGLPLIANYLLFCALYASISFAAHYIRSKKPTPAVTSNGDSVNETDDTDSEEAENAD